MGTNRGGLGGCGMVRCDLHPMQICTIEFPLHHLRYQMMINIDITLSGYIQAIILIVFNLTISMAILDLNKPGDESL